MELLTKAEALTLGFTISCGLVMLRQDIGHSLDVTYFYTSEEARAFLTSLGTHEKARYLTKEYFDLGYMTGYTAFSALLLRRLKGPYLFAFIPGLLDVVENFKIITLLHQGDFQQIPEWLGYVSCLKWTTAGLLILLICLKIRRPTL